MKGRPPVLPGPRLRLDVPAAVEPAPECLPPLPPTGGESLAVGSLLLRAVSDTQRLKGVADVTGQIVVRHISLEAE